MCDCFHLAFPNWHGPPGTVAGRRLRGPEPGADDSICEEPSQCIEGERPRPQGSSPVEEYPEKYTDSDKEGDDSFHKGGKKGKRVGFGSLFDKRSTPKMSKLEEAHSPEEGLIVKTAQEGGSEGLIFSGGGKEGIFIKEVVPESPASRSLSVKEGDQIMSATVYFDNVSYEDALQILEHAQAYKVKLCLKRKPDISESEPVLQSEAVHGEEGSSPEMRRHGKTKRHSDARFSWPKFPSLGRGRKSHFTRSHSSSEADEQRKLELSPTTSDTESPIKTQDALKSKKKHKIKLSGLRKKGRVSTSVDEETGPVNGTGSREASPLHSPDRLESTTGETPQIYMIDDAELKETSLLKLELDDQSLAVVETKQHKVELINLDSTLKTTDITVALAVQGSPSPKKSPDGKKKKKKERSELKIRILGKDKSQKKDDNVKSSPKRLQTLGASVEIVEPTENEKSAVISSVVSHTEQEGHKTPTDTNTQVINIKSSGVNVTSVRSVPEMEISMPKVDLSLDMSGVGLLRKSPRIGKEKTQKGSPKLPMDTKEKTDTQTAPSFKLPMIDMDDIVMEDTIQKVDVHVEECTTKVKRRSTEGTKVKEDPYGRLTESLSKTQLPKREDIEIPGMEDVSSTRTTAQGIKEPKAIVTGHVEEIQAETEQMAIDVDRVKEAVSKLPGFKLPKVDTSGMLIPEEITVIDANAQRITVKTQTTPTKVSDTKAKQGAHFSRFDMRGTPEILTRTSAKLPRMTPADLTSHETITETKVEDKKMKYEAKAKLKQIDTEIKVKLHQREDIVIRGMESTQQAADLQVDITTPTIEIEGSSMDMKSKEGKLEGKGSKFKMPSLDVSMPKVKGPKIDVSLSKKDVDVSLPEAKAEVKLTDVEIKEPSAKVEIKAPVIEVEMKDAELKGSSSKFKMPSFKLPKFGAATPHVNVEVPEVDKDIHIDRAEIKIPKQGAAADITVPSLDIEGPSLDVKSTGVELEGKGGKFKMPSLGLSMPKVKGAEIDLSLSRKDVDISLPEAKAEVKLPVVEVKEPSATVEIKAPEIEVEMKDAELKRSSSKFKMPSFKLPKFGAATPHVNVEVPEVDKDIHVDGVEIKIPKQGAAVDITVPSLDIEGPSLDVKSTGVELEGKGGKFKMPSLGLSITKVKGPDIDLSLSKKDVDVTLPEVKAEVKLPDVEIKDPSAKVEIKAPEFEVEMKDAELKGSPSKFKMPSFKLPTFGAATPNVTIEVPEVDKDIHIEGVEIKIPKQGAAVDITIPSLDIEGPSIDVKSTGVDLEGKGGKFKMPSLGLSMPKGKGAETDLSLSRKDVDISLPEAKAEVKLPVVEVKEPSATVEIKAPEIEVEMKDAELKRSSSKFKMPSFKLPKFGAATPHVNVEVPEVDKDIHIDGVEIKIPKQGAAVDITVPSLDIEGPSLDVKSTGVELEGKGGKFKMPSLGLSMPKVKGPDIDLSLSKKDVDVTLPEVKAEVKLPDVEIKDPSAKVEIKAPEFEVEMKDAELKGSPSKFKMPSFKLPTFGAATPNVTIEVPEVDKDIHIEGVEIKIPKQGAAVDITIPSLDIEGPSIDVKSTGVDLEGKGGKFKMPSLGLSMPKGKGAETDLSLSRKDVDISLPEAKAEVKLPVVEVKEPSATVEIKAPEIEVEMKDAELKRSSSKFKMPSFKLPKFGAATPHVNVEVPEVDKDIHVDGVEIKIPKQGAAVDITVPSLDIEGPSLDVKSTGVELEGKGGKFKMPSLGLSMPKGKGAETDLSLSRKDVDISLPEAKAEVKLPVVEVKEPSATVEIKAPEIEVEMKDAELKRSSSKFKMPSFKLPKFGAATPHVNVEVPEVDKDIHIDGVEIKIPKQGAAVDITVPSLDIEGPSLDVKSTGVELEGKGGKFKMPSLGLSMPKVKGPDIDLSLSKKDVDVTLPEVKAEVKLPDVEIKDPSAKVEIKAPEFEVEMKDAELKGSPSKFKMPSFKLPTFGAATPNVTIEVPEVDKDIHIEGVEIKIPKQGAAVDITIPSLDIEGPSIDVKSTGVDLEGKGGKFKMPSLGLSMPKGKGAETDLSLSRKDVDISLPEAKAEVKLPVVEVKEPSATVEIKAPEIEVEMKDAELKRSSSKFKMPSFKLPKFGAATPHVNVEVPEVDKDIHVDGVEIKIPKQGAAVDITVPSLDIEGPSLDVKSTGVELEGKGGKFKMPSLGLSMPKVKGPDIDLSLSKKDVDVTLPEVKAEVKLPDVEIKDPSAKVEIKAPEFEVEMKDAELKGSPSKFKMPSFKLPTFGAATPNVTIEVPEVDKDIHIEGVEIKIPKQGAAVDITIPSLDIEGPSIDVKSTGVDLEGKGGKFKMPSVGLSMPKGKGAETDLSLSRKDVDISLPEAKAEVKLPVVEVKEPSATVEIKAPEIEVEMKDAELKRSSSKFKMPSFKLPKFGAATPHVNVEVPEVDKDIHIDGVEIKIPKQGAAVDITVPSLDIEGPSLDVKSTGVELEGKGGKFKMPSLGLSMPKVKGPDIDLSLSKKDVDVTLPEVKAEVKLPDVEIKDPSAKVEIKAPEFEVEMKDAELKGSPSKFKMLSFKLPTFGAATPNVTIEVPEVDKDIHIEGVEIKIPKQGAAVDITIPSLDIEGPSIDVKSTGVDLEGKGGKFKMPSLGLSMPKGKGAETDLSLSRKDVDISLPEAKAEVKLPVVEVKEPSATVEIKAPEIEVEMKDAELKRSSSKFKMPSFKLPKFGAATPHVNVEVPEVDKDIHVDGVEIKIPKQGAAVDITVPSLDIEGPSLDVKSTGVELEGKGGKFKMPSLGLSMPKVKGPDIDLSLSRKDVDVSLPEAKAEVKLPDVEIKEPSAKVEIKAPEFEVEMKDAELKGSPSKFKMPSFKLPKFGAATPNVTIEVPEVDKDIHIEGVEIKIPKQGAAVDITVPSLDIEGPSLDVKSTGVDLEGKGGKFKMPSLGLSMPKGKGAEIDLSLSRKDVDISLPEAKAEVKLPDVEIKEPSAKVEIKAPEFEVEMKDAELKGSSSKFKMPSFKLPKFGAATPHVNVEVPEVDKDIHIDGVEIKIPKEGAAVDITVPSLDIEGPSLDVKSTGVELEGKGGKFKMPSLGLSMPKVKGPDIDLSVSKKDVDVTLPEAKAEIKLSDVEVKEPSAKVEIKAPVIEVEMKDAELKGSPSKFKMPSFKLPKFGAATPHVNVEVPEVDTDIHIDGAEIKIPKQGAAVDITVPSLDIEGPSIDVKSTGVDLEGKGGKFKMPSLGLSMPKGKGAEIDLSLSRKDVDISLPEAKAEIKLPDVEIKEPSAKVEIKAPEFEVEMKDAELKRSSSKFKMPSFKLPTFGAATPHVNVEVPEVDKDIHIDRAEIKIPKQGAAVDITVPSLDIEGPSIDVKSTGVDLEGKGGKFKMPSLGLSMPKGKGAEIDLSLSRKDVDISLPEAKAEIKLSDVEVKEPSAKVEIKAPEFEVEIKDAELKGSPSKFKMPSFKLPKFGAATPHVNVEVPEVDTDIHIDGAEIKIPKQGAAVDITVPSLDIEGPSIDVKSTGVDLEGKGGKFKMPSLGLSMPKVKGPDIDLSLSKKDVDVTLPEVKAEVKVPDVEIKDPSAKVEIKAPVIEVEMKDAELKGSPSKFKMPSFKLPKFGAATPHVNVEVPEVDKDIHIDRAEIKIPKQGAAVDITVPSLDIEGPSLDVKSTGVEIEGKGGKFKMPSLGLSMPKGKGAEIDLSSSKKDIDVTLPEAKVEVKLPDVEVKEPSAEPPAVELEAKLKKPRFSLPRFSFSKPSVKEPEVDVNMPDVDVSLPEGKVEMKEPELDIKAPETDVELDGQGSKFKMPSFGISLPKVKGPEIDLSLAKKDVDVTLPEAKVDVKLPDVEVPETSAIEVDAKMKKPSWSKPRFSFSKPSVKAPEFDVNLPDVDVSLPEGKVEVKAPELEIKPPEIEVQLKDTEGSPSKFKMPTFKLPTFGAGTPSVTVELPDVDKDIKMDGAELKIPKDRATIDITAPTIDIEGPSLDVKITGAELEGKGGKFKMPSLGLSMPKVKGPEIDLSSSKKDVDVTLPEVKAEVKLPDVEVKEPSAEPPAVELEAKLKKPRFSLPRFSFSKPSVKEPEVDVNMPDVDVSLPDGKVDMKEPELDIKAPETDVELDGQGSKFKMPSFGISLPKVKGPEIDLSLAKKDVDVTLPEAKVDVKLPEVEVPETSAAIPVPEAPAIEVDAKMKKSSWSMPRFSFSKPSVKAPEFDVNLPDVDVSLPEGKVEVKAPELEIKPPEIEVELKDTEGSPSKFKMPTFKLPTFGAGTPSVTVELPDVDKDIKMDGAELKTPKDRATVDITAPTIDIEGPSLDVKITGAELEGKGGKFKMPSLGLSMPKVKGPEIDLSSSKKDVDVTLPAIKAEVKLSDVEVKEPSAEPPAVELEAKLKKPRFSLPRFSFSKPSVKEPEVDVNMPDVDVSLPEGKVDMKEPELDIKAPETDVELDGQGSKFKMPSFGISLPKVKGPEIDLSLAKKDVDVTLPEAKVDVKLPEVEVPETSAAIPVPEAPAIEVDAKMKKSSWSMPRFSFSKPSVKAPEFDVNLPDVDVSLPEGKVEVKAPELEIKPPEIEVELKDTEGSPSKFKMPTFKLPTFGAGTPSVTVELPDVDKDIKMDGAELKIPKDRATVDITAPTIDIEGPSLDVKITGAELEGKGGKFKMPSLGLSMPKVKGPEIDLSSSKKDVDVTLPAIKAEVKLSDVEVKEPSAEPPAVELEAKLKKPRFSLPRFSFSKPSVKEPEVDVNMPDVDVSLPEGKVDMKEPELDIKAPETDVELDGQGSKFKMPSFGISLPKVKGPEIDLSLAKKDVDVTLPEAKVDVKLPEGEVPETSAAIPVPEAPAIEVDAKMKKSSWSMPRFSFSKPSVKAPEFDVNLPDVDVSLPEGKVEVKAPELEIKPPEIEVELKDTEGSPSKFKMPTFKLPTFGAGTPSVTVELPDVDKDIKMDGAELKTPKDRATVDITAPTIDIEGPSLDVKITGAELEGKGGKFKMPSLGLSMPKVKGPEIDLSSSKKDVDVTLPEAKVDVKLPEVEVPETSAAIPVPEAPEIEVDAKMKKSSWSMPRFSFSKPSVKAPEFDVNLPDVDVSLPEGKVEVKAPELEIKPPEIEVELKDTEGSPSKFKMPTFKLPTFGAGTPSVTVELPDVDKDIKMDGAELKTPKDRATVDITAPTIDIEGPSLDVKITGAELEGKGGKFKMPSLGLSMPKVKGPEIDLSSSKKDVDVTLPEAKVDVKLPEVEVPETSAAIPVPEAPEIEVDAKMKKSSWSMPRFSFSKPSVKAPEFDVNLPDVDVSLPEGKVEVKAPELEIKPPEIEVELKDTEGSPSKFKMPTFKLPKFGVGTPSVTVEVPEVDKDINIKKKVKTPNVEVKLPESEAELKDSEGSPSRFKMPTLKLPEFGATSPSITLELPYVDEDIHIEGAELRILEDAAVNIKVPSVDIKADVSNTDHPKQETVVTDSEMPKTETDSPVHGSPSKFKLPSFKMPRLSFSKPKPEDEHVPVPADTKHEDDNLEIQVEPKGPAKSPILTFTSFGEILQSIDVEFDVPSIDEEAEKLTPSELTAQSVADIQPAQKEDEVAEMKSKARFKLPMLSFSRSPEESETLAGTNVTETTGLEKWSEGKENETNTKRESSKSPERVGWLKFPKFGLSSPSEPAKIAQKEEHESEKSPVADTMDDDVSTTYSMWSSDAFADISSTVTSEQVGLSLSSPTKVTVKYSDPTADVGLEEMHGNIITSTTRTELISVEPNLPEKVTILSSRDSSSSVDTLKLDPGKIHVITSNIRATPEAQHVTRLTDFHVASAGGLSLKPALKDGASWSVEESHHTESGERTIVQRHIVRETSGENRETVVITKQITHVFGVESSEPISGETASSIQRLKDSVHYDKIKFFEEADE